MSNLPRRTHRARQIAVTASATLTAVAALTAAACSNPDESATPAEEATAAESTTETDTAENSAEATTSARSSTSETTATSAASKDGVAKARDVFETLAPASLWEDFDSCDPTGLEGSYECTGTEVGSFQFFDSKSKAVSTTQLITELRSSEVVADTGRFVVGWSTLGTTAVITVVDNDAGQVMQQLVSSDIEDPDKKIAELGLTDPPFTGDEPAATSETSAAEHS